MENEVAIVGIVALTVLGIGVLLLKGYMVLTKDRFEMSSQDKQSEE
jgi:hypothetical protein